MAAHLTPAFLRSLFRGEGDLPSREMVGSILALFVHLFPEFREHWKRERERTGRDRPRRIEEALDRTLELIPEARRLQEQARHDLAVVCALPAGRRVTAIQRDDSRFRNPYLVELLLQRCKASLGKDPSMALELAEAARAVALRLPEAPYGIALLVTYLARCELHRANVLRTQGRFADAEKLLLRAEGLFRKHGNRDLLVEAEVHRLWTAFLLQREELAEAERRMEEALAIYRRLGETAAMAAVLIKRAEIESRTGRLDAAITSIETAIASLDERREPHLLFAARYNLGNYLLEAGRLGEARHFLERARQASLLDEDRKKALYLAWLEGRVLLRQERSAEAAELFASTREGFSQGGFVYEQAMIGIDLALALVAEGRHREVTALAAELIKLFEAWSLSKDAASALIVFREAALRQRISRTLIEGLRERLEEARFPTA